MNLDRCIQTILLLERLLCPDPSKKIPTNDGDLHAVQTGEKNFPLSEK